jgi:glyceraldehyde-3-phosphate dehydrogenase (NADP+)
MAFTTVLWSSSFALLLLLGLSNAEEQPFVSAKTWLPSQSYFEETSSRPWKDVSVCCVPDDASCLQDGSPALKKVVIGKMPQFSASDALEVLQEAVGAWKGGAGVWPQMSLQERCTAIENTIHELLKVRESMVEILMWEIGKNRKDAEAEIDRTVQFVQQLIATIRTDPEYTGVWQTIGSTKALVRRSAIGVILCLAPYNYPINESYAVLMPALLTGNIVLLKIPAVGGLAHLLTMEAFAKTLPPGTVNFVSGSGRATMPPIMQTGLVDGLAFIGGSKAADNLIHSHPHPHRLKVFLQLEGNNMGIMLPDIFEEGNSSLLENALDEAVLGSLSYNGQRCTALKLFFAPTRFAEDFARKLATRVEALPIGLPWQMHSTPESDKQEYSKITPLPNYKRVEYMKSLLEDAQSKGAKILNKDGGSIIGGEESTLMIPAVLYPVTPEMKVYHEEQFGPIVPVANYDDLETVLLFGQEGPYAQQVSIFSQDPKQSAIVLDRFSSVFSKVNLNSQCGRSPDTLPFAGRRSSAMVRIFSCSQTSTLVSVFNLFRPSR